MPLCRKTFKTMTSTQTTEIAQGIHKTTGSSVTATNIAQTTKLNSLFRKLVLSTDYRMQCIHHSAVMGTDTVLYVAVKFGSIAFGDIIYVAFLTFSQQLRNDYLFCSRGIQIAAFQWIGGPSTRIPEEPDSILDSSYASDLHSFSSYYCLTPVLSFRVIENNTPPPPVRIIRLNISVY